MSNPHQFGKKPLNYCSNLQDDGLSYGDYMDQLTFLLFLKIADEQAKAPFNKTSVVTDQAWLGSAKFQSAVRLGQFESQTAFLGQFNTPSDGQPLSNQWCYIFAD